MWTLWNQIYLIKNSFWKFYEVRSERGILIDADSGPLGYVLGTVVVEVEKYLLFFRLAPAILWIDKSIPVSIALTPEAQKNTTAATITTVANPKIEDLPPCPYGEVDIRDRLNPLLLPG